MKYTLLRNATAVLEYAGLRLLIDPALDPVGHRPPVANTANQRPNPVVDLPSGWESRIEGLDAAFITHMHQDHFDDTAARIIDPKLLLFAQPEDVDRLRELGFREIVPVEHALLWEDILLMPTPAQHGSGKIARAMAPVSGFMLNAPLEPVVYLAGDTIWYEGVAETIAMEQPDVIVINASGASFLEGGPIVMNAADIAALHKNTPDSTIIVQHLEAINHCHETRAYYREALPGLGVDMRKVHTPNDGETIELSVNV